MLLNYIIIIHVNTIIRLTDLGRNETDPWRQIYLLIAEICRQKDYFSWLQAFSRQEASRGRNLFQREGGASADRESLQSGSGLRKPQLADVSATVTGHLITCSKLCSPPSKFISSWCCLTTSISKCSLLTCSV